MENTATFKRKKALFNLGEPRDGRRLRRPQGDTGVQGWAPSEVQLLTNTRSGGFSCQAAWVAFQAPPSRWVTAASPRPGSKGRAGLASGRLRSGRLWDEAGAPPPAPDPDEEAAAGAGGAVRARAGVGVSEAGAWLLWVSVCSSQK